MLKINGKTFMNLQEAVQWLLDNNALPFQSSANYIANTEIGMGTLVNPSPAKVRIGSLIFFADSKVSTVTGITENGFIVSDQYNDLVDDVVYVANVAQNASGHLIVTLSNGDTIDTGLIKQVSSFSINASQHLIATYNDGSTNDLGAIFTGNISITGNITATGTVSASATNFTTINGESDPSVKPLYFHPIWARDNVTNISQFTMTILDNSATPYTWARITSFLNSLPTGARLNCSGTLWLNSKLWILVCIEKRANNDFFFRVTNSVDGSLDVINFNDYSYAPTTVEDGVNKIN